MRRIYSLVLVLLVLSLHVFMCGFNYTFPTGNSSSHLSAFSGGGMPTDPGLHALFASRFPSGSQHIPDCFIRTLPNYPDFADAPGDLLCGAEKQVRLSYPNPADTLQIQMSQTRLLAAPELPAPRILLQEHRSLSGQITPLESSTDGIISGVVRDADTLEPLAGIIVSAYDHDFSAYDEQVTGEDGAYTLNLPPGEDYWVSANGTAAGYLHYSIYGASVAKNKTTIIDFQLQPPPYGLITGTVTDGENNAPVAGLWVDVWLKYDEYWLVLGGCSTDETGSYGIDIPVGEGYMVRFWDTDLGCDIKIIEGINMVEVDNVILNIQLPQPRLATISGIVTDADCSPIEDVQIYVYDETGFWDCVVTDISGHFTMQVPEGAGYTVYVFGLPLDFVNVAEKNIAVSSGENRVCDFQLAEPRYGTIRGTVTDTASGNSLSGVRISAYSDLYWGGLDAITDAQGKFNLEVPVDTGYYVFADGADKGYSYDYLYIDSVAEGQTVEADFQLIECGTIKGTVSSGKGALLGDVSIEITSKDNHFYIYTFTDSQGYFERLVPPGDDYKVIAMGYDQGFANEEKSNICVSLGQVSEVNFQLAELRYGTIRGTVTDTASGNSLSGVRISAYSDLYWGGLDAITDAQGKFNLEVPVDTGYYISADGEDKGYSYDSRSISSVAEGQTVEADFQLAKLRYGTISGTVKSAGGAPLVGATVSLGWYEETLTDAYGAYSFENVLAGYYDIVAYAPGYKFGLRHNILIEEEQVATINFELFEGITNDDFANREQLEGNPGQVIRANVGATTEPGEPDHADIKGGASVWWSWSAPGDGTVIFDTAGSNFDTILGAYSGTGVGNFTALAGNDDWRGFAYSNVAFPVEEGNVYHIAVDGWTGVSGLIVLSWEYGDYKHGDVNSSMKVDVADAILVLRHIVGLNTLDETCCLAADVNRDDDINVADAILILRYIVGLISALPVC